MFVYVIVFLFLSGVLLLLYMRCYEIKQLRIKHVHLHGDVAKQLTIAHFTDTHFKAKFEKQELTKIVKAIQRQEPDIIVFTGDLMDHYTKMPSLKETLPPILQQVSAKGGKFAVYGNHDIGGKAKYVYQEMMEESGFQVLRNAYVELPDYHIAIYGIDDAQLGYEDRKLCERSLQPYQILLSHEPDIIDVMNVETINLMLCGHTHGGQVAFPILRNIILPKGGQHYRKGLYHHNNTTLFVSSGVGTTKLNLRFHNLPEIVVYHIEPKKEDKLA